MNTRRSPSKPRSKSTGQNKNASSRTARSTPSRGKGSAARNRQGDEQRRSASTRKTAQLGGEQIEGRQAVREALRAGTRKVHEIFISEDAHENAVLAEIIDLASERRVPVRSLNRKKLEEHARTEAPQGIIATAQPIKPVPVERLARPSSEQTPLVVALDGVTDPGNLGAILRSAEVAGATGVILPQHRSAGLTPSAVKAAAGATEYLPIALVGGLPAAISKLIDAGLWVVGLDGYAPDPLASLRVADEPLVLVVGAEGRGISALVRQRCHQVVSIPMHGQLDSLNASTAAAVALFKIAELRDTHQP